MGKIKISALGDFKKQITEEQFVELNNDNTTVFQLIDKKFGIPSTAGRINFVINGKMQRGTYVLQPNDTVVVLKMGGAG